MATIAMRIIREATEVEITIISALSSDEFSSESSLFEKLTRIHENT